MRFRSYQFVAMMSNRSRWVSVCLALVSVLTPAVIAQSAPTAQSVTPANVQQEIRQLIDQLGAERYATRVEAETRLRQYGIQSMDMLRNAMASDNPQIASTARYLLRSSDIVWFSDGDSQRIQKLLRDYSTDDLMDRAVKIQMLSEMHDDEGLGALARLSRYESYGDLSKRAALSIMRMSEAHLTLDQIRKRWLSVKGIIADGNNVACTWLRHQATMYEQALSSNELPKQLDMRSITSHLTLRNFIPESSYEMPPFGLLKLEYCNLVLPPGSVDADWWTAELDNERKLLLMRSGETSQDIIEELCKFSAEFLIRSGNRAEALVISKRLTELPVDARELVATQRSRAVWAIDHGMPEFAIELLGDLQGRWANFLRYFLAEAYRWEGNHEKAAELADMAFVGGINGNTVVTLYERVEMGKVLTARGQHDWAAREFQAALDAEQVVGTNSIEIVTYFAPLLQDGGDYAGAAQAWKPIVDKLETDPLFKNEVDGQNGLRDFVTYSTTIRSMYLHLKGLAELKSGKSELAKVSFREAITLWPENVDVAIEMYRIEGDKAWREEVNLIVDTVVESMMDDVKVKAVEMRNCAPDELARNRVSYANSLNTYAWLIANVDRDLDFALQTSLLSNRLAKDKAAFIDTLAKCYHVHGELDKAVYWQFRAVSLEPFQRQLVVTLLKYRDKQN